MLDFKAQKAAQRLFLSLVLVFLTNNGFAQGFIKKSQSGEEFNAVRIEALITEKDGTARKLSSVVNMTYVELKTLGVVVIHMPFISVMPWAPMSVHSYDLDLQASFENQKYLCELVGYKTPIQEELGVKAEGYNGRELAFFTKTQMGLDNKGRAIRVDSFRKESKYMNGRIRKNMPTIARVVCAK